MFIVTGEVQNIQVRGPYKDGFYKIFGEIRCTLNLEVKSFVLSNLSLDNLKSSLREGDILTAHIELNQNLTFYKSYSHAPHRVLPRIIPLTEVDQMKDDKTITLTGTIFYPHLFAKNTLSDKYQLDLRVDATTKGMLEDLGVLVKNKITGRNVQKVDPQDLRGDYITLRTSTPPIVIDSKKNSIPPQTRVGYGSTATVVGNLYPWKKGTGNSIGLSVVQITNLIPGTSVNTTEMVNSLPETEGFDINTSADITTNEGGA